MDRPSAFWLNGTVVINGTDVGTLSMIDGPVEIEMGNKQVSAAGSRPTDVYTDDIGKDYTISMTGCFWDMQFLNYLEGLIKSFGVLDDGLTPSANYAVNNENASIVRPYVELLIKAIKHGTSNPANGGAPYRVEIWALRAKLSGALPFPLSKSDHTKVKLTFKLHADPDPSVNWFEIRDEELES